MKAARSDRRINTTLGELIATISEVAFENCANTKAAYTLAGLALAEILKSASFRSAIVERYVSTSEGRH
jgi:hypothetical protein